MLSTLAACAVWLLALCIPSINEWQHWPFLCGILLLFCGFVSVIIGMLYKIVPFLIWLHLQNQAQGRLMAPNMKKIITEQAMSRQMQAHFSSCTLLLMTVFWPEWFVYPAGLALIVANGLLMLNLLTALSVYRNHQQKIATTVTSQAH